MSFLHDEWSRAAEKVELILAEALPAADAYPEVLHEAMRYSTLGGGKRLRALLVMGACAAVGGDVSRAAGLAAAVEMIHASSLIHDDLPCLDDDDLRRGKPTNHIVFGEAIAVLAGDALLTEAFAELARMPDKYGVSPEVTVRIVAELAQGAGSRGLLGGQAVDILSADQPCDEETLRYIHTHKTGALFRAALRSGALLGGAGAAELEALTRYAEWFGLAFQITDDILDAVGDAEQLGKRTGRDEYLGKQTYPRLYGLERSREMARECVRHCLEALQAFSDRAELLRELAGFVVQRSF
ncbi:MAG TPA: polyprenyl synthetase family protein [Firmicutes bacterium]|jgi:geranylgeranyl diphosphate synthase type II|nr:polyprenyl synthetase family protein [Bacillota bacterium]